MYRFSHNVLIPDLWGESSDALTQETVWSDYVLIPDLWGESSDAVYLLGRPSLTRLNPRFVGRVFRRRVPAGSPQFDAS